MGSRGSSTLTREQRIANTGKYRYHATTPQALPSIYKSGLKPNRGMLGKGVYMAPTEKDATDWTEASTGGKKLLRVSADYLANKTDYDDYDETQGLTTKKIPSKYIEVKDNLGNWMSLKDYAHKNYRAFGIQK